MEPTAIQDDFPDDQAHCFGCGRLNQHGHHIRTFWDGDETVTRFTPEPDHIAIPGSVYGGLIASLIDCHGASTAAAAGHRADGRPLRSDAPLLYVTARLTVEFLKPTPIGVPLELRGRIREVSGRKTITTVSVLARGVECARGEVVAVRLRR
jgi:acyl-coenzyme A thioesterase PaaI-like protein